MFTRSRLLPALCACTVMLAAGAAPASATVENLEFTRPGAVTENSVGTITFTAGVITVRCRVVFEGEVQERIVERSGERLGSISRATASSCEGSERPTVTFLSLPWSLTYSSFSGTQPERMTAILGPIRGLSVRITSGTHVCLYSGEVGLSFALRGEDPYDDGALSTLTNRLSLVSGELCPSTASMSGSFEFAASEALVEILQLPLIASPRYLTRTQALNGAQVTFNPRLENVSPTTALWRVTMSGWSTDVSPCLRLIRYPENSCTILVTSTAGAVDNMLTMKDATERLVALLPVTGQ